MRGSTVPARRPRARPALTVTLAALALAGCSTVPVTTTAPTTGASAPSSTAHPLDLQVRPVLDVANAQAGDCATPPPATPDPGAAARMCSQDGFLVYSLGPAAVTGDRVTGLDATMTERTPQVQVRLDPMGGAALTRLTAEAMVAPAPRNRVAIVSHGRVQSAPVVTDSIDGGVFVLTGFDSMDAAQRAVDFLVG